MKHKLTATTGLTMFDADLRTTIAEVHISRLCYCLLREVCTAAILILPCKSNSRRLHMGLMHICN